MYLSALEKQTIVAALRNGLGLTHACRGLHRHPMEVSDFIRQTPVFELECNQSVIAGYQTILVGMNDAANKKAWEKWRTSHQYINQFVTSVNLWQSLGKKEETQFNKIVVALKHCKTLPETATALGFTDIEFHEFIYKDSKLVHWFIQNGHSI
jgi:hypothetical protein